MARRAAAEERARYSRPFVEGQRLTALTAEESIERDDDPAVIQSRRTELARGMAHLTRRYGRSAW